MGEIGLVEADELEAVWSLAVRAVRRMNEEGNAQWGADYPTKPHYAGDAARRELYAVREGGRILGVACINAEESPEYAAISWKNTGPTLSVHRMAVDPEYQGRGLAGDLLEAAERLALERGLAAIHLDTYAQNSRMQALLRRRGYIRRGEIRLHGRPLPFPCFEKTLRPPDTPRVSREPARI